MAINLSQLSEEASQPQGSWWSRTLEASKKQAEKEKGYTPLDFAIKSLGASPEASRAQAQSEKDMGLTDYMQKSAEIPFKSLVSVPTRAITYGENILATGEDILGGKYFGTEVPSWQESAEKRRQEAKAQEERTFNLFDFSKSEQETARTAVDFGATAPIGGTLAKGGSLFARTATNATIGAGAMVPFTTLTEGRLPTAGEYAIGGGLGATLGAFGKGTETGRQITKDFTKPAIPKVEKGVEAEAEKIVGKTVPAQYGKKQVNIAPPIKHWYTAIGDKLAGITPERLINSAFKPTNLGKSAKRILYGVKNLANDTAEYIGMVRTGKLTGEIDDLQGFAQSLVENQDIVGKKIGKAITKLEGQATISEETMGKITNTLAKDYEQATPAYTILSNVKNLLSKARTYQDLWNIKSIFGKEVENLIKSGGNASESFRVLADVVHELDNIVTNKMSKLKGAEYRGLNKQYALIKRLSLTAAKSANVDMRRAPETLAEQIGVIGRIYSGITSPIATTDKMLAKFVAEANTRGGAYKRFLEFTDQKAIDLAKTLKTPKKQNLLKPKTATTSEIVPEVNVAYQKNIADKYGKDYGIPEEDITASVKEIQDAYPDAQIRIVDNLSDSEGNALAGMFDPNTKEILISREGAMKTTAWHEQAHSSLDSIKSQNPERYASIESEATKLYGSDWEEHVAEEAFYFMKRGQFKSGNIGTALKEFVVNLVNEMKAIFGKGDAVRKFQSDLTKGKLNNKGGKSLFPEKGEIKKQVVKEERALLEDAKKYNSADEFVKAQKPLYHGGAGIEELKKDFRILTPKEKLKYASSGGGNFGLSTTSEKEYAKQYSQNIGNRDDVLEVYLNPKAKIYDLGDTHIDDLSSDKLSKLSKKYDLVKSNQENEYRVLTNNGVITESQLKEIYNKAHSSPLPIKKQIAGEKAKNAPPKNYTGWYKGVDGKMKFEIDDSKANIKNIDSHSMSYGETKFLNGNKLNSVIDHPELFKQYPEAKNWEISQIEIGPKGTNTGEFYIEGNTKKIGGSFKTIEDMRSILLHEIQHGIQEVESFAKGGGIENLELKSAYKSINNNIDKLKKELDFYNLVKKQDKINNINKEISNLEKQKAAKWNELTKGYKSLAGEVEARNVQKRMNMSMQERLKNMPETTEDVQKSKQIVRK